MPSGLGMWFETACIAPGQRFRRHAHDSCHVVAVLGGGFVERSAKTLTDVGPGSVRVAPAARHDLDFGASGARCLVIETDAALVGTLPRPRFLLGDPWLRHLLARMGTGTRATTPELVIELLAQVRRRLDARRRLHPPPWLIAARDAVAAEPTLALSSVAARLGVHRVHLAREFRDHFGMSVGDFARRRRLERARTLVLDSDLPLSLVALEAGFADQSHLTRAFQRDFRTTPGRLRAANTLRTFKTGWPPGR